MKPEADAPPSAGRPGVSRSGIAIGAAFAVALGAIAWGYLGGGSGGRQAPPASTAAVAVPASATAPASATVPTALAPDLPRAAAPATGTASGNPAAAARGVVKPKDEVLFSAKIAARIAQMPFKEGERFKKGDLLVGFDCSRLRAEANAAWAANRASRQVLQQSVELDTYNAIGKNEVQIARAKSEQTGAEATALESQMRDCSISAPFSGIVVQNISHQHENAAAGKELMRVLNDSELEMHLIAPSAWLAWLQPGSAFRFRIDETGRTHEGKVIRLGASVDPVSQTVRVVGTFTGGRDGVLPGMSGSADFDRQANATASR
ncbi:efflux RND transporter periplasmic adaptor subunit [Variovorax sp. KK3]|uniref:efflux RND transporter periplasmic adaptor subunit n=1 Tax=Variovorax sp. KK3 TaxID=1855728 RepID=UPI0009FAABA1|nr:efflux RND transporter periplasmic adaptor subunit [Variovorax sp. KK3]